MSSFGSALEALKAGRRVRRAGWNGKGMWLVLLPSQVLDVAGVSYVAQPCIAMFTAKGLLQPGWLASQNDLLEDDWELLYG